MSALSAANFSLAQKRHEPWAGENYEI